MGILAAIALPSLLSCGNAPVRLEPKNYIGTMNRGQQAYFLEKQKFASSIPELQLGIKTQTKLYNYSMRPVNNTAVFHYGIARQEYVSRGLFDKQPTKSYVGVVFTAPAPKNSESKDEIVTLAIACETNAPTTKQPPDPIYKNGTFTCAKGTISLTY